MSNVALTPLEKFFVIQKGRVPKVDVKSWRLAIDGYVEKHLSLTYEDLSALPKVRLIEVLECYDNPPNGTLIGVAEWEGIPVKRLLEMAQPKAGASSLLFHSLDGYSTNHKISYVEKMCVMLALKMNGAILPAEHGYPVRLVSPGMYGYKWAKWVYRIEVLEEEKPGYWEARGYHYEPFRGVKD
jgi:DMSO/TMAO reductase YedYZ molybdopterin-dependent catalytic subunit